MDPRLHDISNTTSSSQRPASTERRVKKRNRNPVSCIQCQARRSKCDRKRPCATCAQRGEDTHCVYGKRPVILQDKQLTLLNGQDQLGGTSTHARLEHLEHVVRQFMQQSTTSTSIASTDGKEIGHCPDDRAAVSREVAEGAPWRTDVGQTHWSTILDSIDELKAAMHGEASNATQDFHSLNETTLLACKGYFTLADVIELHLPPRPQIERMLSVYFNSQYFVVPIIHSRQFLRQFEVFWQCPHETDSAWVSMLFSILSLSCLISTAQGTTSVETPRRSFFDAAAKCLNVDGYLTGRPFALEALLLYAQCKYVASTDACMELVYVLPMVCRLAFKNGLHREPGPRFAPFEAERRRRLWLVARHFDVQVSMHMGVPLSITPGCHDTQNAHNLLDTDFDEDITQLPAKRPDSEITPVSSFVFTSRMMGVFAEIYQQTLSLEPIADGHTADLESKLRHTHEGLSPCWHWKPISQNLIDGPQIIMFRLSIELLYQKALCLLHRKRMAEGNATSKRICLDAAMSIVHCVNELHGVVQPGGQMEDSTWMMSSTVVNDFLLASMILTLTIVVSVRKASTFVNARTRWPPDDRPEIDYLQNAHRICWGLSVKSQGARKVAHAIGVTLARYNDFHHIQPVHTASDVDSLPLSLPPAMAVNQDCVASINNVFDEPSDWGQMDSFLDNQLEIDWTMFDRYVGHWDFNAGSGDQ